MTYEKALSVDVWWIEDTSECRRKDEERDDDENKTVDEARQDLHTVIAETHDLVTSILYQDNQSIKIFHIKFS